MKCGNKPSDGGNLLLEPLERDELLKVEPRAASFIRKFIGSDEYLNGADRYCLWLKDATPAQLRQMPAVMERVKAVRQFRLDSTAAPTRRAAETPTVFFFVSQPTKPYVLIPEVSSERRKYVPLGFMNPEVISSNKNYLIAEPSLYVFGVLQSLMHMTWMRTVAGRMKSDYQYSATMVYNTFPWPTPTEAQKQSIEAAAQEVLDARKPFSTSTLADLYDPNSMPPQLVQAHSKLDNFVDAAYGKKGFKSEAERMAFLFGLYGTLTSPLVAASSTPSRKGKKSSH
jgi:hypothetical protein